MIKILETPRDAMQGLHKIIPTIDKIRLINALIKVGFDIIDVGSFVSNKIIPQLSDTDKVINGINLNGSNSKLFVLVANEKGGLTASKFSQITYIGFPFSVSETFLFKNIRADTDQAWKTILKLKELCDRTNKKLIVYLTMAFGNPYNDPSGIEILLNWTRKLYKIGIDTISLSDIIGVATAEQIGETYSELVQEFPAIEFGLHLHVQKTEWYNKLEAAFTGGCIIFDGVINGIGGCPMTGYELLGNLPTGNIIEFAEKKGIPLTINKPQFAAAFSLATSIFN